MPIAERSLKINDFSLSHLAEDNFVMTVCQIDSSFQDVISFVALLSCLAKYVSYLPMLDISLLQTGSKRSLVVTIKVEFRYQMSHLLVCHEFLRILHTRWPVLHYKNAKNALPNYKVILSSGRNIISDHLSE